MKRYKKNGITYILYNEKGKLAMTNIMGKEKIISFFNFPQKIRFYHLWSLGIFNPKKQYVPYN